MIARLREALRAAGYDPEPEELADIIWLATQNLARLSESAPPDGHGLPHAVTQNSEHARGRRRTEPIGARLQLPEPRQRTLYSTAEGPGASGPAVTHLRIGTPKALPRLRQLERALRPLRTTVRSRSRYELDLPATIATIADGFPDVALRPARELLLDATLVVDDGLSMSIWHDAAHELYQALHRLRAFGRTRLLGMGTDRADTVRLTTEPFRPGAPGTSMVAGERHLVLVLTDAVGEAWSTGAAQRVLYSWARQGPLAVLQVLPEYMWQETGLPTTKLMVFSARPATSNRHFKLRHPHLPRKLLPVPGLTIPVIDVVSGSSAAAWAQLVSTPAGETALPVVDLGERWDGGGTDQADGEDGVRTAGALLDDEDRQTADRALDDFLGYASPPAQRLAAHLACAGSALTIPLMRLVQRSAVPEAGPEHLAEVFLAGLLRPHRLELPGPEENPEEPPTHEPLPWNRRTYAYPPLLANSLRELIKRSEEQATREHVSQYLAHRRATEDAGMALISDPSGVLRTHEHALPLATVDQPIVTGRQASRIQIALSADDGLRRLAQLVRRTIADSALRNVGLEVAQRAESIRVLFPSGRTERLLLTTLLSGLQQALEEDDAARSARANPVRVAMDFTAPGQHLDSTLRGRLVSISRHPSNARRLWVVGASRRLMVELYGAELEGSGAFREVVVNNGRKRLYLLTEQPDSQIVVSEEAAAPLSPGDSSEFRTANEEFAAQLAQLGADLTRLRIICGNPSLRAIARAAPPGVPLARTTISDILNGKRLPQLGTLLALVQVLSSLDRNGHGASRSDPALAHWRERWRHLTGLRHQASHSPSYLLPYEPGNALIRAPEYGVWRLIGAKDPHFSYRTYQDSAAPLAQDRWSGPNQGILYCTSEIEGCFADALAAFRVDPQMRQLVKDDFASRPAGLEVGHVPSSWRTSHVLVRLLLPPEARFLDVNDNTTLQVLSRELRTDLESWGVRELTEDHVRGSDPKITRRIGTWAREQLTPSGERRIHGIAFRSRFGARQSWAIFHDVEATHAESRPISPDTEGLRRVAAEYGLTIH